MKEYDGMGSDQDKVDNKPLMDQPAQQEVLNQQDLGQDGDYDEQIVTGAGRLIQMNKSGAKAKVEYLADESRLDRIQEKRKNKYRELGVDPENPVLKLEEDGDRED